MLWVLLGSSCGACLAVPAGWFLQLSVGVEGGGADVLEIESRPVCRGAMLRPSLMHYNAKAPYSGEGGSYPTVEPADTAYGRFLLSRKRQRHSAEGEGSAAAAPRGKDGVPLGVRNAKGLCQHGKNCKYRHLPNGMPANDAGGNSEQPAKSS